MISNIRKYRNEDLDRIIEIWYNSNLDTYKFVDKIHWQNIKNQMRSKFLDSSIFIYEEDKVIKAFIKIDKDYIDELYVDHAYRSKGIGKSLLDFAKSFSNNLTLNVFQKNISAIKFYEKNGFKIIEENVEELTKEKGYFMKWEK